MPGQSPATGATAARRCSKEQDALSHDPACPSPTGRSKKHKPYDGQPQMDDNRDLSPNPH